MTARVVPEIPPHSAELARGILGAPLQEPEALPVVLSKTIPEHFLFEEDRVIRARMGAMADAGRSIDATTLIVALEESGELDAAGGRAHVAQLYAEGVIPASLDGHIAELIRLWAKRRGAQIGRRLTERATNGADPRAFLDEARAGLGEVERALSTARAAARLRTLSWREMTASAPAPIAWHWPGWVPLAAVALIIGAGESLKSWLALLLAIFTAAGRAPLVADESVEHRLAAGPVLYFTAENALDEEQRRSAMLKAGLGLPAELPLTFVPAAGLCFGSDEDYSAIVALVEQLHPVAIFIDSAIALSGVADENANVEVRAFMRARILPLAREHGATVYLVGHSPKAPTQPGVRFGDEHVARGAGEWRNAADVVLYLRRDPTLGPQAVTLRHAKMRIGARHTPLWFALEDVEPGRSVRLVLGGAFSEETGQGAAAGLAKAVAVAVAAVKRAPGGIYQDELQRQRVGPGLSKATARRALNVLRGQLAWPAGPQRGKRHAVVTEDRHGKRVFFTFLPDATLPDEDSDDA